MIGDRLDTDILGGINANDADDHGADRRLHARGRLRQGPITPDIIYA